MNAALFVETEGCYFGLDNVDPWDIERDARRYDGPHPVVAHPPCQRWGAFWHGSTRKPHRYFLGDDAGCFASALASVRRWGGILEHPANSHAWAAFGLNKPSRKGGWISADDQGGWTCCVEQGHYGHQIRKPTWLYACHTTCQELTWGTSAVPKSDRYLKYEAKHGHEKARRCGEMALIGGRDKSILRARTPVPFRDLLISIAETVRP